VEPRTAKDIEKCRPKNQNMDVMKRRGGWGGRKNGTPAAKLDNSKAMEHPQFVAVTDCSLQKSLKWWVAISSLDFKGHPL